MYRMLQYKYFVSVVWISGLKMRLTTRSPSCVGK